MDNENNNTNLTNNNENNFAQQQFTEYQTAQQNNIQQQNLENEVVYYPPQNDVQPVRKKKKRILLKSIIAFVLVVSISIGSVAGYVALTDNGYDIPFINSANKDEDDDNDGNVKANNTEDKNINKDLPSLTQLASKENALSVPQIVNKVAPSVVGISTKIANGVATGSGIIMSKDGYIITNAHVIEDSLSITVVVKKDNKDEEETAKVIGIDTKTDLAVIKINRTDLTPAEFGKSSDLQVGELAIAVGNPLGLELSGSVTGGIISALNRQLSVEDKNLTLIQTDAAINPGNSGGPLVNCYGQVIGINSIKISSEYAEGLGFAIPIDDAKPIIDALIQYGYVKGRPMIGITCQTVSAAQARYNDVPQGIYVVSVTKDTGAYDAGIKAGDIITAVNGKAITTLAEFNKEKESFKAGDKIKLSVYRDGKDFDVQVTLTENKQ